VLEVRLIARQGHATLDTVAKPVQNFLLFDYEVIRGSGRTLQIISASYIKPAITNFRFFI
jgi:hypothetical protein